MKKEFEKWAESRGLDTSPYTFNPKFKDKFDYNDIVTQGYWECWQAASQPSNPADGEKVVLDGSFKCPECGIREKHIFFLKKLIWGFVHLKM